MEASWVATVATTWSWGFSSAMASLGFFSLKIGEKKQFNQVKLGGLIN